MDRHHSLNFRESAQCAQTNPGLYLRVGASGRRDRESCRISWDRSVSVDRIDSRAGYRGMALTTVCAEVGVCSAYHQRSASLSRLIQRSGGFADWVTGINAVQSLVLVGCVNHSRVVEGTNM